LALVSLGARKREGGKAGRGHGQDVVGQLTTNFFFFTDIDILSTSAVHQGTGYVDFSLKIQPKNKA
jgi:hypothetical protein